ncbi:glycosyltransferase family 1 protein [Acinetobacter cumulans]|uniref:Glycosyltransferase family 1 protein n=1 Tax=Acinetobacter cumulans TaxID=2136182 RepID=A0A498D1I8_9GAMM|nr:glycosyltransferase family 4 protein [Acinetobacter cumulans]RLL35847.1 glycosyltransferase family 1 protein [Acinetobacter cumulans]
MKKVLVIQKRMTHYREAFFESLKLQLEKKDIQLILAYGEPSSEEKTKGDQGNVEWAFKLNTKYFLNGKICWQPFDHLIKNVDAIVFAHENKLIFNLIPQWFYTNRKIILWGHGENLQKKNKDIRDYFKKITARKADWWLGYTEMSRPLISSSGFPNNRITILNNSIDTNKLKNNIDNLNKEEIEEFKEKYNIYSNSKVGVYIGSLYDDKRIEFLLESILMIKEKNPNFVFFIAGKGEKESIVKDYTNKYPWINYLGLVKNKDKALLLSISKIMINPGLVGLGILDSFVSKTPMFTTDCGLHSPEISYLENNINGVMTNNDINIYIEKIDYYLNNEESIFKLMKGCENSSKLYTVENMAKNFAEGIDSVLKLPIYRFK